MDNTQRLAVVPAYSASDLAASTTDAYSFPSYGRQQWAACALVLACRGFNQPEATAILYSKIMRLAADDRTGRKATSNDLTRLLDLPGTATYLRENLDEYVLNIIGEDLIADAPVPVAKPTLRLVWSRPNA